MLFIYLDLILILRPALREIVCLGDSNVRRVTVIVSPHFSF